MRGKIHGADKMFLRTAVGTAESEDGNSYELTLGAGVSAPMIRSKRTGNTWEIQWKELLMLAIEEGVDDEAPPEASN